MKDFPGHSLAEIGHVLLRAEGKEREEQENGTSARHSASGRSPGRRFLRGAFFGGKLTFRLLKKGVADEIQVIT